MAMQPIAYQNISALASTQSALSQTQSLTMTTTLLVRMSYVELHDLQTKYNRTNLHDSSDILNLM